MDSVSGYVLSLGWGVLWRYALLAGAVAVEEVGFRPPLILVVEFTGIAVIGVVIGLWRRGSRFAAVWRMLTVSLLVAFVAPATTRTYPYVLAAAFALATIEPLHAAAKRRHATVTEAQPAEELISPSPAIELAPPRAVAAPTTSPRQIPRGPRAAPRLAAVLVLVASVGGLVAVEADSTLLPRAENAVTKAVDWARQVVAGSSGDAVLPVPNAAPVAPVAGWSTADCAWASTTLAQDRQLDLTEAEAVAAGRDTRYGRGSWLVAYYRGYAADWQTVGDEVAALCSADAAPTPAQVSDALSWFVSASQAHRADAAANPSDASWDLTWIGDYARLSALYQSLAT